MDSGSPCRRVVVVVCFVQAAVGGIWSDEVGGVGALLMWCEDLGVMG